MGNALNFGIVIVSAMMIVVVLRVVLERIGVSPYLTGFICGTICQIFLMAMLED